MADWPCIPVKKARVSVYIEFPCVVNLPYESDLGSWLHWHIGAVALAKFVAHDIHGTESVGCNEAVIQVVGLPSHGRWDRCLIFQRGIPTLIGHTIGNNLLDVTMGSDERQESHEGSGKGVHGCNRNKQHVLGIMRIDGIEYGSSR